MQTPTTYDVIGRTYAAHRRPDARVAARIIAALGNAASVIDIGAGTGSYEPRGREIVAVEPSWTMVSQRPPGAAPAVLGVAEALPFRDRSFDAAMAVLTVHHWPQPMRGIAEMRRVARGAVVVMTWDPEYFGNEFWFARDYVPEARAAERGLWTVHEIASALTPCRVEPVPVPHDCTDGFFGAYWRRPEAYLDPGVRSAISALARIDEPVVQRAVACLAADLQSGEWKRRYGHLCGLDEIDLGYRLVVSPP